MLNAASLAALAKPLAQIQAEQIAELYQRLYPLILRDFPHINDVKWSLAQISAELSTLSTGLVAHTHLSFKTCYIRPNKYDWQIYRQVNIDIYSRHCSGRCIHFSRRS